MVAYARAHVIKNMLFEVDTVDYANQVTKVQLVPDQATQTLKVGVPSGTITDTDSATWTLALAGVQDFGTGSLGAAIRTAYASGTTLEIEYQPVAGVGQDKAVFEVKGIALPFGGEVGQFRTFDVVLPVMGEPTWSQSA